MDKLSYSAGATIFRKGDSADEMYKIVKGKVTILGSNDNEAAELATLKDGAFFGEMGIIENAQRSAKAVAESDVELISINGDSFDRFVAENAADVIDMMRNLSTSVRNTTKDYIAATKTVEKLIESDKIERRKSSVWQKLKNIAATSKEMAAGLTSDSYIDDKRSYKAGEVIFNKGQTADRMFKLLDGEVEFFNTNNFGVDLEFATISKGAIFGEMAVIDKERRNAYAVAKTDVELLPVVSGELETFLETHPEDAIKILKNLSAKLRKTTADYIETLKTINELVNDDNNNTPTADAGLWQSLLRYSADYNSFLAGSVSPDNWYLGRHYI